MKRVMIGIAATVFVASLAPFVLIARSRATLKDARPVHLFLDMDKQAKGKPQRETPMFADKRFMRPQVEGALAQEDLVVAGPSLNSAGGTHPILLAGGRRSLTVSDPVIYAAVFEGRIRTAEMTDEAFAKVAPPNKSENDINADSTFYVRKIPAVFDVSMELMQRGQERFNIYCAPCHGESGYGDGANAARAAKLATTPDAINGWVAPQNLQEAKILARPDGHIFNTITNGIRTMAPYDKQIAIEDRWAIIAYLRALQRSQNARAGDPGAR
jgi:mono/diheme cytochrome c family protein